MSLDPFIRLDWNMVANLLEMPPRASSNTAECPACHATTILYNDHVTGGSWSSCRYCGFSAGPIDFCAETWKCSVDTTIKRVASKMPQIAFADFCDPANATKFLTKPAKLQKRFERLKETSNQRLLARLTDAQSRLVSQFLVPFSGDKRRWQDTVGRLFGIASTEEVEETFNIQAKKKLFPSKCQCVILIPFFDAPGRICGFECLWRQERKDSTQSLFRSVGRKFQSNRLVLQGHKEAGLAWMDEVADYPTIVATNEIDLVLRLQSRHASHAISPLPMVCWKKGETAISCRSWQFLKGKRLVLWARDMGVELLSQAIYADAFVSLSGPKEKEELSFKEFFRRKSPENIFEKLSRGRFWVDAVEQLIREDDRKHLEVIAAGLFEDSYLAQRLEQELETGVLTSLKDHLPVASKSTSIILGNKLFYRTGDAIIASTRVTDRPSLAIDAVMIIDEVISLVDVKEIYYRGSIRFKGDEVPFVELKSVIDRDPAKFVEEKVLASGVGIVRYDKSVSKHLVGVSMQLKTPRLVVKHGRVGWNDNQELLLPFVSIKLDGTIHEEGVPILADQCPGKTMRRLESITNIYVQEATRFDGDNGGFVTLLGKMLNNILSPATMKEANGIVCLDDLTMRIARSCGKVLDCREDKLSSSTSGLLKEHNWPMLFTADINNRSCREELNTLARYNSDIRAVVITDELMARAMHAIGNWDLVVSREDDSCPSPDQVEMLPPMVTRFLADVLKSISSNPDTDVTEALKDWLETRGVVTNTDNRLPSREESFGEVIRRLLSGGHLSHSPLKFLDSREVRTTEIITIDDQMLGKGVWINKTAINRVMDKMSLPRFEDANICQLLSDAGIFKGDVQLSTLSGWFVEEEWLLEVIKKPVSRPSVRLMA